MTVERFTPRERLTLAIAVVLAAIAGAFVWNNYGRAFPEANLTFEVNRATSEPVAEKFLAEHAPRAAAALPGLRHAAIFRVDQQAKVYLERELGLEEMGTLVSTGQVELWAWAHRFFRPLDKEEVRVDVSPAGTVVGFAHPIAEDAPGPSLDEAAARGIAESFAHAAFSLAADDLEFIEARREDRPHRRDWTFTFQRKGWRAREATYRFDVGVNGDEPASFRQYLKVPDAWTQGYQRLRSANDTTAQVALLGIVLTILAAIVVLVREGRRGNVRWRLVLTLSGIAFVLVFALSLNNLPIATYSFDTTGTYGAFLARQALAGLGSAGGQALLIVILVAAGEALYRRRFPQRLRLGALLRPAGWRSKRFATGLVLGYCLAVLFIAYQVAFYLVGNRFGAWNPAEVPFDNLLNTSFPWLAVLFMGFYPAVSEEFMSRIFSIPLVERLARSKIAAVIVPALIWGFAHANYPAQPFFIRGVEVSIAGLAVGIVLYRFGAVPCLVWHYVVDAGYTSILLVRSGNPYFVATAVLGTGALLVPLLVAVGAAFRRGGFVADETVLNAADQAPAEAPAAPPRLVESIAAPTFRRLVPLAAVAAAAALAVGWLAPDPLAGIGVTLRPDQVRAAAAAFLRERGVDAARWRLLVTAAGQLGDEADRRYLLEHGGTAAVASFAASVPQWSVRAFRPEDREEWRMQVSDPAAAVVRFDHTLPEEAPGASLDPQQAREKAERYLRDIGLDPTALRFKDSSTEKRPARLDYSFTWQDPRRSVADAEYLVTVTIQGDVVDAQTRRLKLPEAWRRAWERQSVAHYGLLAVKVALIAALMVHGLFALYRGVRAGAIRWRNLLLWTGLVTILAAVGIALTAPLAWTSYTTAWPAATFRASLAIGLAIAVLLEALAVALVLAVLAACYPASPAVSRRESRRPVAAAAILAVLAASGAAVAVGRALDWLHVAAPTWFPDLAAGIPGVVATAVPALAGLGPGLFEAVLTLGLVALAMHLWSVVRPPWLRLPLAAGLLALLVPVGAVATWRELAMAVAVAVVELTLAWALLRWALARNVAAYVAGTLWLGAALAVAPLVAQPGPFYRFQGWVLLAAGAAAIVLWLFASPRSPAQGPGIGGQGSGDATAS